MQFDKILLVGEKERTMNDKYVNVEKVRANREYVFNNVCKTDEERNIIVLLEKMDMRLKAEEFSSPCSLCGLNNGENTAVCVNCPAININYSTGETA